MSLLSDLASFPQSGPFSIGGFTAPRNSGLAPVSQLRNLLDDSWSRNAADRAASLAGSDTALLTCLTSNGLFNADGSVLGGAKNPTFSLPGLGSVLKASNGALGGVVGDLQMALGIQSLAAGLAKTISNGAGGIFALLDRALGASPEDAKKYVDMASKLTDMNIASNDLFAGAFSLGGMGMLGGMAKGVCTPGDIFSGEAGNLLSFSGLSSSLLSGSAENVDLQAQLDALGIDSVVPPDANLNDLASLFDPVEGGLGEQGLSVGDALSDLNDETVDGVKSKVGDALSSLLDGAGDLVDNALGAGDGEEGTVDRFQGVTLIDGEWTNNYVTARNVKLGLAALLGAFALFSAKKGRTATGLLSAGAAGVLLATLLGNSAPVQGSFLTNGTGGWLGTPSATRGSVASSLAEACAFNSAMSSALGSFFGSSTDAIDKLMYALECRRSTYGNVYDSAYGAQVNTDLMLQRMLALMGVTGGGSYPGVCASSGLGLGRCV